MPLDKGKGPLEEPHPLNSQLMMNTIIWNIRGVNNAEFRRHCQAMVNIYKTTLLALLETRMADHEAITKTLGFTNQIQFPASGFSCGIVIMWDNTSLNIQDIVVFPQGIHVAVKVSNPSSS